jgi:hypothetical protein
MGPLGLWPVESTQSLGLGLGERSQRPIWLVGPEAGLSAAAFRESVQFEAGVAGGTCTRLWYVQRHNVSTWHVVVWTRQTTTFGFGRCRSATAAKSVRVRDGGWGKWGRWCRQQLTPCLHLLVARSCRCSPHKRLCRTADPPQDAQDAGNYRLLAPPTFRTPFG